MDRLQCNWPQRIWGRLLERRRPAAVWLRPRLVELVRMGCVRGPEATSLGRDMGRTLPIPEWPVPASGCGGGGPRGSSVNPSGSRWPAVAGDPGWIGALGWTGVEKGYHRRRVVEQ